MTNLSLFRRIIPLLHVNKELLQQRTLMLTCRNTFRHDNTITNDTLEKQRTSPLNRHPEQVDLHKASKEYRKEDMTLINNSREKYPEFLPNPDWRYRDRITERMEREDMYRRRKNIHIPMFCVGSVLAVSVADKYSPGKSSRFVGICIHRSEHALRHQFILRNVIDDQGLEVMYEMYNPLLQQIEVLRLERRLDDQLFYLRDCALEYSYIPQHAEAQMIHEGMEIPVNETKVVLGPRPWSQRWERYNLKGVEEYTGWKSEFVLNKAMKRKEHPQVKKVWEKTDIMKHYRESINPIESAHIYKEVHEQRKDWDKKKK